MKKKMTEHRIAQHKHIQKSCYRTLNCHCLNEAGLKTW